MFSPGWRCRWAGAVSASPEGRPLRILSCVFPAFAGMAVWEEEVFSLTATASAAGSRAPLLPREAEAVGGAEEVGVEREGEGPERGLGAVLHVERAGDGLAREIRRDLYAEPRLLPDAASDLGGAQLARVDAARPREVGGDIGLGGRGGRLEADDLGRLAGRERDGLILQRARRHADTPGGQDHARRVLVLRLGDGHGERRAEDGHVCIGRLDVEGRPHLAVNVEERGSGEKPGLPRVAVRALARDHEHGAGRELRLRPVRERDEHLFARDDPLEPDIARVKERHQRAKPDDGDEGGGAPRPTQGPGRTPRGRDGRTVRGRRRTGARRADRLGGRGLHGREVVGRRGVLRPDGVEGVAVGADAADGGDEAGVPSERSVHVRVCQLRAFGVREVVAVREGVEDEERPIRQVSRELGADACAQAPPSRGALGEGGVVREGGSERGPLVGREVVVEEEVGCVAHGRSAQGGQAEEGGKRREDGAEALKGALYLHLDRRLRRVQRFGDLGVGVAELAELEDLAGVLGEGAHGAVEVEAVGAVVGVYGAGRGEVGVEECLAKLAPAPVEILELEEGGFEGEGFEARGVFERVQPAMDADERVLHEVVGVGRAADAGEEEGPEDGLDGSEERVARRRVSALRQSDGLRVEWVHGGVSRRSGGGPAWIAGLWECRRSRARGHTRRRRKFGARGRGRQPAPPPHGGGCCERGSRSPKRAASRAGLVRFGARCGAPLFRCERGLGFARHDVIPLAPHLMFLTRHANRLLRRCCFFAAITFALPAVASAQTPVDLGDRIGEELDAEERAYFGLFPRLAEDAPFRFEAFGVDSVRVLSGTGTVALTMAEYEARALSTITETFEEYPSVVANPAWVAEARFLRLINPRTPVPQASPSSLVRIQTDEGQYQGYVLYTTDSLLVLSPEVAPRDPSLPGAYALDRSEVVSADRVQSVTWQRWGPYGAAAAGAALGTLVSKERPTGAAFGLLIGATLGDFATRLVGGRGGLGNAGSLRELAYFDEIRPPEYPGPEVAVSVRQRPRPEPGPMPRGPRRHEFVSVEVQGRVDVGSQPDLPTITGIGSALALEGEIIETRSISIERRRRDLSVPYRLGVAVRPLPWVRLGAYVGTFDSVSTSGPRGADGREYITTTAGSFRPYAEAILPLIRWQGRRLEISAGGGREEHTLTVVQREPLTQGNSPVELNADRTTQKEVTNWFTQVGVEVFTTPFSSLFVRYSWHPLPSTEIAPLMSRHRTFEPLLLRTIDAHTVDFGYNEFVIGARAHF